MLGGIFEEISSSAVIANNTVTGNGATATCSGASTLYFCGINGISISDSHDVQVYGNTLSGNLNAVAAYNGHSMVNGLYNISVHDNTMSGGTTGIQTYPLIANAYSTSHWYNNTYQASQQFFWASGETNLAGWTAAGQS